MLMLLPKAASGNGARLTINLGTSISLAPLGQASAGPDSGFVPVLESWATEIAIQPTPKKRQQSIRGGDHLLRTGKPHLSLFGRAREQDVADSFHCYEESSLYTPVAKRRQLVVADGRDSNGWGRSEPV